MEFRALGGGLPLAVHASEIPGEQRLSAAGSIRHYVGERLSVGRLPRIRASSYWESTTRISQRFPRSKRKYRAAARLIREAFELGAATVVFDIIYARGTETMAEPILKAIAKGEPVVLAGSDTTGAG